MLKITIFSPCWFWGHIFCGVYISGEVFSSPLQTRVNHPQIINREFVCKLQTKSRLRRNIADKLLCQNWVVDVFRLERLYLENEAKEKKNHTHIHRSSQTNPTASNALFESSQRKAARKHSRRGFMLQTHMFPWLRRSESFRLGRSARNKIKNTHAEKIIWLKAILLKQVCASLTTRARTRHAWRLRKFCKPWRKIANSPTEILTLFVCL